MRIILCDPIDVEKIIKEEKEKWVIGQIKKLNVINDENIHEHLRDANIEIIENRNDQSIKIYKEKNLICEWKRPKIELKYDDVVGKNSMYSKIHLKE